MTGSSRCGRLGLRCWGLSGSRLWCSQGCAEGFPGAGRTADRCDCPRVACHCRLCGCSARAGRVQWASSTSWRTVMVGRNLCTSPGSRSPRSPSTSRASSAGTFRCSRAALVSMFGRSALGRCVLAAEGRASVAFGVLPAVQTRSEGSSSGNGPPRRFRGPRGGPAGASSSLRSSPSSNSRSSSSSLERPGVVWITWSTCRASCGRLWTKECWGLSSCSTRPSPRWRRLPGTGPAEGAGPQVEC